MVAAGISAFLLGACIRGLLPPVVAWIALLPLVFRIGSENNPVRAGLLTALSYLGLLLAAFEGAVFAIPWAFPAAVAFAAPTGFLPGWLHGTLVKSGRTRVAAWSLVVSWNGVEYLSGQRWLWGQFASPVAIGYTQMESPLLGLASIAGVSGVGFAVVAINVAISQLFVARSILPMIVPLTLVVIALAINNTTRPLANDAEITVAIVQPAMDSGWYEASENLAGVGEAIAARLLEQTAQSLNDVDLFVWPEAAVPAKFTRDALLLRLAAQGISRDLLAGAILSDSSARYNSVLHFGSGEVDRVFDKLAPVPLGEAGITPGNRFVVGRWGGTWVGLLVCLDSAYPAFASETADLGAEVIVVLSDDSFARGMATPDLHLRSTVFRAAETGTPVVFASASGPSAFIDASGRIMAGAPRNESKVLRWSLPTESRTTPYTRFGDTIGRSSVVTTLVLLALALRSLPGSTSRRDYPLHER